MRTFFVFICSLFCCAMAHGSLYGYPEDKPPAVSLKEACTIGETILGKLGLENGAYIYHVTILGDEGQTGEGAWTLHYQNARGDKIQIGIYFPEDFCLVMLSPKNGEYSEKEFTRDGRVSEKFNEWRAKLQKDKEDSEKVFGPTEPKK